MLGQVDPGHAKTINASPRCDKDPVPASLSAADRTSGSPPHSRPSTPRTIASKVSTATPAAMPLLQAGCAMAAACGPSAARGGAVRGDVRGHSVEAEFVALDVLHHDARLVVVIGRQ